MKLKSILPSLILMMMTLAISSATRAVKAQEIAHRDVITQEATLYSGAKHRDFEKAIFSFELGLRGDALPSRMKYSYNIRYGEMSNNGDSDWIGVPTRGTSSQIKDLGEIAWSDIYDIPFLYASPVPHDGLIALTYDSGKVVKIAPEGVLVKAITGHMYLVHSKDEDTDIYILFRIEAIKPSDECRLSWRVVPSPETP